jgi:Lon protease-like protein
MAPEMRDLPLFPLPLVLLPTEVVPLHIFEERYKEMIGLCLSEQREFGIVWLSDDGLKEIGCTARVAEVLEQMDDGRMNILVRGGTPFRLLERQEQHAYPAGTVELLGDGQGEEQSEEPAEPESSGGEARRRYADLLESLTEERPEQDALDELSSYEMAATVDIDLEVKQGLLELRSEEARLSLLARLFKAGIKSVERARQVSERAAGNGKVDVR